MLIVRDRRTQMLSARVVPRKGMIEDRCASSLMSDLERPGYKEVILKYDGEPAMKRLQAGLKRRQNGPSILENLRANEAAERAVKAFSDRTYEYYVTLFKLVSAWY